MRNSSLLCITFTAVLISAPIFAAGLAADVTLGLVQRFETSPSLVPGTQTLRAIATQVAVVAALGVAVNASLEFLRRSMEQLVLFPPAGP